MPENRTFKRKNERVACEYRIAGKTHSGLVSDLSPRGIFVQGSQMPEEGAQVEVVLHDRVRGDLQLWGRVVRKRRPHRSLTSFEPGGFALEVESAPEEFFSVLVSLGLLD
jgi:hypothetical protein